MANPFIAVRITPELDAAIAARMQETGQSKSDVVIEALKSYLGIQPFTQRLTIIEQRLAALEDLTESTESSVQSHASEHLSKPPSHSTEHSGR
jgi:C4-dicarboxylate-specific signal transduction histidine kinase